MILCRFSECPYESCRKELLIMPKRSYFGFVQKYYNLGTMHTWILVQSHFQGLCRNRNFRFIHLCYYLCRDLSNGPQFNSGKHLHRKKLGRGKNSGNSCNMAHIRSTSTAMVFSFPPNMISSYMLQLDVCIILLSMFDFLNKTTRIYEVLLIIFGAIIQKQFDQTAYFNCVGNVIW